MVLTVIILLTIISWLRLAGSSADFDQYYLIFIYKDGSVEPFWHFLRKIINFDTDLLLFLYGMVSLASLLIKLPILIQTKMARIAIPIYLCAFFILHEYTQIRVALALAFAYLLLSISFHNYSTLKLTFIYAIPSLFHYSLMLLVIMPLLLRIKYIIVLFGLILIGFIFIGDYFKFYLDNFLLLATPKFGDSSPFNVLNMLSTYFMLIHFFYYVYFRKSQSIVIRRFHNASLIYLLCSIPFGVYQFGTAYFRFQEISASLLVPAIFYSLSSKKSMVKWSFVLFFSGYYLALSYKIFRDLI